MSHRREHKQQGCFMHRKKITRFMGLGLAALVAGTSLFVTSASIAGTSTRVVVCFRGKTVIAKDQAAADRLISQGATVGACVVTECRSL
jgi:hypothetical protein